MAWRQCCLSRTRQVVWPSVLTWAVPPSPAISDLSDHYNKHHQATSARGNLHINIINALVRNLTFPKVGISLSLSLSLSVLQRGKNSKHLHFSGQQSECPGQLCIIPNISHLTFLRASHLRLRLDAGPVIWEPYFQHDHQAFRQNKLARLFAIVAK